MTAGPTDIWAAIPTPFSPSFELDEPGLRHNARHYIGLGLRGVFCNGLIGEVWAMTLAERKRVVEVLVEEGQGRLGVSTVISASSIHETLELGAHAKEAGADHAVIMVPTSGPRSREQQFEYVKLICDRLDMPIVIFNAAGATGSPLSPELFSDICTLPQIVMLKTTAYDYNTALRKAAHGKVVVSDPLEEHFLENRLQSEQPVLYADPEPYLYQFPGVCPIANYVGQLDRGEKDAARAARERLEPLRRAFNKWVMNPLIEGHMPNAAVKRWSEMMGMAGGAVRAPIRPLSPIEKQTLEHEVRIAFEQSGLPNPEIAYA